MNNLRSQHEPEIFAAVVKYVGMAGEFLSEISDSVIKQTSLHDISWENLRIPEQRIFGMRILGFPHLKQETYDDWISINSQSSLLSLLINSPELNLISEREFRILINDYEYRWSIFYGLTRPGFSQDLSQALIQITAHCPAGPPQYGSLLYLEMINDQWQVQSSYGLYNQ